MMEFELRGDVERGQNQAEKVRQCTRDLAHDFNNLFAAIKGNADLLLLQLPAGEPMRQDAEDILRAVERGAPLIERLLALGRGVYQPSPEQ